MGLTNLPKIKPSKGVVYVMAVALGTFTYFFTRTVPATPAKSEVKKVTPPSP